MTKTELPHGPYEVGYKPSGITTVTPKDRECAYYIDGLCQETLPEKECNMIGCKKRTPVKSVYDFGLGGIGIMENHYKELNEKFMAFSRKVKALRDAQNAHAKTMQYGLRNQAIALGKEVDEMLTKLIGE